MSSGYGVYTMGKVDEEEDIDTIASQRSASTTGPSLVVRRDTDARWQALPVLLIGLISGVLYLLTYQAQRALYHLTFDGVALRGITSNRTPLLAQSALYYGTTIGLFALYVWLLALCRQGALRDRRVCTLAVLFPVLFNLGLLLGRPYLSIDLGSYIAGGYFGSTPGGNPYVQPAFSLAGTPFGASLEAFGWRPIHGVQPYGPLWVQYEVIVLRLTHDVAAAALLLKGLVVAASLGSAALIWAILGRVRPADQLLGTLLYLWNPVIIVEFAAEGHNDALMILCVLAALLLTVGGWPALALIALLLGVLTKYVPLILLPALLAYFWCSWRKGAARIHLIGRVLLGLFAGLGLAVLFYRPLWAGTATFQGLREQGTPEINASITGGLAWALAHSPPAGGAHAADFGGARRRFRPLRAACQCASARHHRLVACRCGYQPGLRAPRVTVLFPMVCDPAARAARPLPPRRVPLARPRGDGRHPAGRTTRVSARPGADAAAGEVCAHNRDRNRVAAGRFAPADR